MRPDCKPARLWRILLPLSLTLFLGVSLIACDQNKNTYAPPPPPKVTVQKPTVRDVVRYAYFTGNTSANATVDVRARVKGFLQDTKFQPSAIVKKNDVLFLIDPKSYQASVDQAKAQLEVKKTQYNLKLTNYQRQAYLGKKGAVSEYDVLEAKAETDEAKAQVTAAQAELEAEQIQLDYTQVLAPIDGRINRAQVDTGNLVGADGNTLLATIVNDDPIYAYFNVSETDLLTYKKMAREAGKSAAEDDPDEGGARVFLQLSNETDYPHKGQIDYMNNQMDPKTGTIQVRGVFPNSERYLMSGFFARLRVPIGEYKNAVLVPEEALGADQQGSYVYIVNAQNKAEYRPITVGAAEDGYVVITKGVDKSDRVIVQGLQRARAGQAVTPEETKPEQKKGDADAAKEQAPDANKEPAQEPPSAADQKTSSDKKGQAEEDVTGTPAPKNN